MPDAHITVRFAAPADLDWCAARDDLAPAILARKIDAAEILIAALDGIPVGFLRLEYLWSTLPFIALIRVDEPVRWQGAGRALLAYLEDYLRENGRTVLMSSSQVDEPAPQAWHRHMGFVECGILAGMNDGGVGEVFFCKVLY